MATHNRLDQIVKGAPPPHVQVSDPPSSSASTGGPEDDKPPLPDPTALLPSSPPQIYLNLLILEASLRAQYLTLRARRRQNTFVLTLLTGWTAGHAYLLFLPTPSAAAASVTDSLFPGGAADPHSTHHAGGHIGTTGYWLMDVWAKLALMSGLVTVVLFWGTGQWERGVRWPRRWVGVANRGLRVFNCKIVVLRGPWWRELLGHMASLTPFGGTGGGGSSSYALGRPSSKHAHSGDTGHHHQHQHQHHPHPPPSAASSVSGRAVREPSPEEDDLSPGGHHIKLLLLSKPFTPDFRQDWETYRAAYWERENERRAEVRRRLRQRRRERARQQGGWLWWTGWRGWAAWRSASTATEPHPREKPGGLLPPHLAPSRHRRAGSASLSRSSSRSSTPTVETDDTRSVGSRPSSLVLDHGSASASTASGRRKKAGAAGTSKQARALAGGGSRPVTPKRESEE